MPSVDVTCEHQHQNDSGDHDLIGDGIKENAQFRHCPLRPRKVAIEIIGNPHQAVQYECKAIIKWHRLNAYLFGAGPKQKDEDGHSKNARQGQDVG